MNERIKKLAEQAKDHATHLDKIGVDASMEDIFKQKFAELIVRECAKISLECGINLNREDFRQGIARNIKEHFGVE